VPIFGHHNLLTTASGEGLSKRLGHFSLGSLRETGLEPMAAASLAVLVGSSEAIRPIATLEELGSLIQLDRLSRAPAKFDDHELEGLNARLLHGMDYGVAAPRLAAMGIAGGEAFWLAVRGNISRFDAVGQWWNIVNGPMKPVVEDGAFLEAALGALPEEPWSGETWAEWTGSVKATTGRKGKDLFMPLRLALTGLEHGPELKALLPLIGRARAVERLKAR
jgi:glutamyl-tRNA synthetase